MSIGIFVCLILLWFQKEHCHLLISLIMLQNSSNYISPSPFSSTSAMIRSTSSGAIAESKHNTSLISSGDKAPLLSVSNNSNAYFNR